MMEQESASAHEALPRAALPYSLGELAIACHDEWLGTLRVIKELEIEQWRKDRDHPWTTRIASEIAFSRHQADAMRVLWISLKAMSRHEAEILPLIAVALATENQLPFPIDTGDAA